MSSEATWYILYREIRNDPFTELAATSRNRIDYAVFTVTILFQSLCVVQASANEKTLAAKPATLGLLL